MKILKTHIGLLIMSLLLLSSISHADNKGETLEEYRARTQEDVYRRSNDAYVVGGKELRDAFTNLHKDADDTWKGWKNSLGDKWDDFKQSLKDKADDASDNVHQSFHNTIHDFKQYMDHAEDKGAEYSDEAKQKAQELLNDLRSSYEDYKAATKAKVDQWTQGAKDKAEDGAEEAKDKANQAYRDAKAKYHKSKESFAREMDKFKNDASSKSRKAEHKVEKGYEHAKANVGDKVDAAGDYASNSYESLKHGMKHLYEDAAATLNKYQEKVASKWEKHADQTERGKSPADEFHNSINDFMHYEKVFEETGDKYSLEARGRLGQLLDNLKHKYEDLKEKTKERVKAWTPGTTDNGQSPAFDEYDEALFRFNQCKARLNTEMGYLSGSVDKAGYQNAIKAQLEDLYNDASSTLLSWKGRLGDKWDQATGGEDQGQSPNPDAFSSKDFLGYLQAYEATKAENSYTDEARIRVSELIDNLQDRYQAFKDASVKKWDSLVSDGDKNAKALQKYDQAKVAYMSSKGRLQDELDYLTGKLSKEEYDAKVHAYDKVGLDHAAGALKSGWRSIKNKIKAGKDYIKETVTGHSDDEEKAKKDKKDKVPSEEM